MSGSLPLNESTVAESLSGVVPTTSAAASHVWRELARNLWLTPCCLLGFSWIRESPAYSSYLIAMLLEPVTFLTWGQVPVVCLLMAKSAFALLPVLPLSFWLFHRVRFLWGRFAMGSWLALVLAWLFIDQIVLVMTSNHSLEYIGFAMDATTWQWTGESAHLAKLVLWAATLAIIGVWGVFKLISAMDSRWGRTRWHAAMVHRNRILAPSNPFAESLKMLS